MAISYRELSTFINDRIDIVGAQFAMEEEQYQLVLDIYCQLIELLLED